MGDKLFTTNVNKYGAFDDYYDFKFWVNGKEFRVHRLVFASKLKSLLFLLTLTDKSLFQVTATSLSDFSRLTQRSLLSMTLASTLSKMS